MKNISKEINNLIKASLRFLLLDSVHKSIIGPSTDVFWYLKWGVFSGFLSDSLKDDFERELRISLCNEQPYNDYIE